MKIDICSGAHVRRSALFCSRFCLLVVAFFPACFMSDMKTKWKNPAITEMVCMLNNSAQVPNRWFSRYVIGAMLADEKKNSH